VYLPLPLILGCDAINAAKFRQALRRFLYVGTRSGLRLFKIEDGTFPGVTFEQPLGGWTHAFAFDNGGRNLWATLPIPKLIRSYSLDAHDGRLDFRSASDMPRSPWDAKIHKRGEYLIGSLLADGDPGAVTSYAIDPDTGSLALADWLAPGFDARDVVFDGSQRFVYAVNQGSHDLDAYAFDPDTGDLSVVDTQMTAEAPDQIVISSILR
jgi:6-phosphogluconolactonase (cycloisomerase 2 family)